MNDAILVVIIVIGVIGLLWMKELFFSQIPFSIRKSLKPYDEIYERVCEKKEADGYWIGSDGIIYYGHKWLILIYSIKNKRPR